MIANIKNVLLRHERKSRLSIGLAASHQSLIGVDSPGPTSSCRAWRSLALVLLDAHPVVGRRAHEAVLAHPHRKSAQKTVLSR